MKKTGRWLNRFLRAGYVTAVVGSVSNLAIAQTPSEQPATPATSYSNVVQSMIEDAMRDGVLDASERQLILDTSKRMLSPGSQASVESRLAEIPGRSSVQLDAPTSADEGVKPAGVNLSYQGGDVISPRSMPPLSEPRVQEHGAIATEPMAVAVAPAGCSQEACGTGLFDNLYIFGGADAWKGPIDCNSGNNFGARLGFNAGVPLSQCRGIGGQFGLSYGMYDFHGRDDRNARETAGVEEQLFLTTGVFQRATVTPDGCGDRVSWGLVYDHMFTDNTGACAAELSLGQLRGQLGYALDTCNEVGVFASLSTWQDDSYSCRDGDPTARSIDQASVYFRHKWYMGADTRAYVGLAEDPGQLVFGTDAQFPLDECWSVYSGVRYIMPSASGGPSGAEEEIWNVSAGLAYYPRGNGISSSVNGPRWMPLMPVADNGSFTLETSN